MPLPDWMKDLKFTIPDWQLQMAMENAYIDTADHDKHAAKKVDKRRKSKKSKKVDRVLDDIESMTGEQIEEILRRLG